MTQAHQNKKEWHVDRSISVGHILTTLVIAISAFTWGSNIDRRVATNAQSIEFLSQSLTDANTRFDTYRSDIRQDLRDINAKLDRIIEGQATP